MSITVQIAEDQSILAMQIANFLTQDKDIKIINISSTGEETINSYKALSPDILILDLNLPNKNGAEVLDILCNLSFNERNKCNVIILSGNIPNYIFGYASKIYRFFEKPCDFRDLLSSIHEIYDNNNKKKPNIRELCENTALKLGFNTTSFGTNFLIDSILLLHENNLDIYSMDYVYREISLKYNIPVKKIKWNIEKSINSMFRFSNFKTISSIFPEYDGRKPTPKYCIELALQKLKNI